MDKDNRKHRDIDGGYAWVILLAAFLCHGICVGSSEIFGILYIEILDDYKVGKYLMSWVITLQTVFWGLTGILSGRIIHRFGSKLSIIIGSMLVSGSFIISSFTSNFYTLFLTFGIMAGAAQSFVFVGGASVIYSYFKDRSGLATSVYALGHPTIGMVLSYITPYLLELYGYRGAILLVGAICLNGIPLAMLMRDPSSLKLTPTVLNEHSHSNTKGNEQAEMLPLVSHEEGVVALPVERSAESESSGDERAHMNAMQRVRNNCCLLRNQFGLFLLTDWKFVMILICVSMTNLSHISLHWFIPDRAIEIGLSNHDAAMAITLVNVANILSRLFFGTTSSNNFIGRVIILCVYVIISGLNSILVFVWTSYWTYMMYSGFYGLLRGLYVIYMLLVVVDIVGENEVSLGLGLIQTFTGILFVISIPTFGYLNEITHSYTLTFILYGGLEIFGGFFLVTIPIYDFWKRFKNQCYVPLLP